ncbi:MAG: hypothetical protein WCY05_02020 [Candidatus Omnitrophota bacterium]
MNKKIGFILSLMFLFISSSVFAETIVLKSGKTVEGKILEQTDKYIKVDIEGISITYYLDEIQSIGAKPGSMVKQPFLGQKITPSNIHNNEGNFKPGSEPTGFRDMKWGVPLSAFPGMKVNSSMPGSSAIKKAFPGADLSEMKLPNGATPPPTYIKENESLQFEGVNVDEIDYSFDNDKFSSVLIATHGKENFEKLRKVLGTKYGEQKSNFSSGWTGGCAWQGNETEIILMLMPGDAVVVSISSMEAKKEIEKRFLTHKK